MYMREPLISIVVPVYNVAPYLQRCVSSLIKQSYKKIEIVLVNDGSNDQSGQICDELKKSDKRIIVVHKSNGGLSDARNVGIAACRGEYVSFVDSDDAVDNDYIEYLYKLIQWGGCDLSLCTYREVYSEGKKQHMMGNGKEEILSTEKCLEKMLYSDGVSASAIGKLYKKSLFHNIHFPVGRISEDLGTVYKLVMGTSNIACGYKDKYSYYVRKGSITTSSFNVKSLDLLYMANQMTRDICIQYPQLRKAALRYQMWAHFSMLNKMIDIPPRYFKERDEIISFLRKNGKEVLKNPRLPRRDRVAIHLLNLGFSAYKFAWKAYVVIVK